MLLFYDIEEGNGKFLCGKKASGTSARRAGGGKEKGGLKFI
jgi:hypothetical protein